MNAPAPVVNTGWVTENTAHLVALDVPVLRVHGRGLPGHVQLGRRGRLDGQVLGRGRGNCGVKGGGGGGQVGGEGRAGGLAPPSLS